MLWDLAIGCIIGLLIIVLAALTYGKGPPAGRVVLTRPSSRTVDGFGGTRGYDYSYAPTVRGVKPPFPVGLRSTRRPTTTFQDKPRR